MAYTERHPKTKRNRQLSPVLIPRRLLQKILVCTDNSVFFLSPKRRSLPMTSTSVQPVVQPSDPCRIFQDAGTAAPAIPPLAGNAYCCTTALSMLQDQLQVPSILLIQFIRHMFSNTLAHCVRTVRVQITLKALGDYKGDVNKRTYDHIIRTLPLLQTFINNSTTMV